VKEGLKEDPFSTFSTRGRGEGDSILEDNLVLGIDPLGFLLRKRGGRRKSIYEELLLLYRKILPEISFLSALGKSAPAQKGSILSSKRRGDCLLSVRFLGEGDFSSGVRGSATFLLRAPPYWVLSLRDALPRSQASSFREERGLPFRGFPLTLLSLFSSGKAFSASLSQGGFRSREKTDTRQSRVHILGGWKVPAPTSRERRPRNGVRLGWGFSDPEGWPS